MHAAEIASRLEGFPGRGAGSDAERGAARWLADQLASGGRDVVIETFWCRPNWALAHAWHAGLALAGSLVSVSTPRVGGGLLLAAIVFVVLDEVFGVSPGRRLTPEHASQNVVARASHREEGQLRLILTANYDAGRTGLVYRDALRRPCAAARTAMRRLTVGWLGWMVIAMVWLEVIAVLRVQGHHGRAISIAQLAPTIALVVAVALLLDVAISEFSAAGGDNGSGVGVALALTRALDTARYGHVSTDVVLTGAGDVGGIGLRKYLRAHRRECSPGSTAFIGIAPCTAGSVRWWRSDGRLWPYRYARALTRLAAETAAGASYLHARAYDGRGASPALAARVGRVPALSIGCLDGHGLAPRSHQPADTASSADPAALDSAVQFGLMLVDAIDAALAAGRAGPRERQPATPV